MSRNTFEIEGKFNRIDVREAKGREYKTLILDVEDGNRPQVVPIRLWGRTVDESREWRPGDVLLVKGKLGGRSWQDKVFGDNSADSVQVIEKAQAQGELPQGNPQPVDDGSFDTPF
jgi:single-stranded DNA-binding protein